GRGIAGVILFQWNVDDPAQLAELSRVLKAAAPGPLLLSIDQEGGRVQRLRPPHWTELPSMRRVGELDASGGIPGMNGTAIAEKLGLLIAEELSACGIDQDFAPVLDVDTNPDNPVIGDRSFGRDPVRVARLGAALGKGLETGRVASCGKHFPGHGDTSQDSHLTLPRPAHDRARPTRVRWRGSGSPRPLPAWRSCSSSRARPPPSSRPARPHAAEPRNTATSSRVCWPPPPSRANPAIPPNGAGPRGLVQLSAGEGAFAQQSENAEEEEAAPQRSAAGAFGGLRARGGLRAARAAQPGLELGLV